MLAIDTNLIVRYLTGDHHEQSAKARTLIDNEPVFVSKSVLLETEWVLRSAYDRTRSDVQRALAAFVGLPSVTVEDPSQVVRALDAFDAGMDFANTLHLASAAGCDAFITFDQRLATARKLDGPSVRTP